MPQFDVYTNPSKKNRQFFPYLVDVQHTAINEIATRIVIPLGKREYFRNEAMTKLTPEINYEGETLLLLTPQIASIPAKLLTAPIGTLEHIRNEIIASIDFSISGF